MSLISAWPPDRAARPMRSTPRRRPSRKRPAASQATSCDPLLDAVRLTRDAACAWMNLLQNPAIATLPE